MKKIGFLILVMLCFLSTQCDEDALSDLEVFCDASVVVDASVFDDLVSDDFQFVDVSLIGDCLSIEIGASGCDAQTWAFTLVDSGVIAESLPEQRNLKLKLENTEVCTVFFSTNISFDISALQINGSNKIILNLEGWDNSITYTY